MHDIELIGNNCLLQYLGDIFEESVYMKDLNGVYIYHNNSMLKLLKQDKIIGVNQTSFTGKTDYDIFPINTADAFSQDDRRVIETRLASEFEEIAYFKKNIQRRFVTHKKPMIDKMNNIIGILGFSKSFTNILLTRNNVVSLTKREMQTLAGLYYGLSISALAIKMCLSPRTLEDYYKSVKIKLHCTSKNELFELVHKVNFQQVLTYFYNNL